jgi:predicted nucleic acid-binding Zn ribbon protein
MRKNNTEKIGKVIEDYIEALDVKGKLKEVRLIRSWEEIVGKTIAKKTDNIYIKEGKLFVVMNSSIARNELSMLKNSLIGRLNEKAGSKVISDIIIR